MMRNRIVRSLGALVIALAIPTATMGATTPVAVYHGTWSTAEWTGDPGGCPFVFLGTVRASGNWNVTILPGGEQASVHIDMFTTTTDPVTQAAFRVHVDAWGGRAFGDFWAVDSVAPGGFVLSLDTTSPATATNTFVLSANDLTFTIAPWIIPGAASCDSAIAHGTVR